MLINGVTVVDTFAEAFAMWGARVLITAANEKWAAAAARTMTGFATSVIGCKCEAGIERVVPAGETPDGRPGVMVLLFATSAEGVGKRLVERIGQCVMTCPTTACFNALASENTVVVGGLLRYFGDGFQLSKLFDGRRFWRVPVMDGEFVVEERFGVQPAVGGGNLLLLGEDMLPTLAAAEAAVNAMRTVPGVILPFPDGVVRTMPIVRRCERYRKQPSLPRKSGACSRSFSMAWTWRQSGRPCGAGSQQRRNRGYGRSPRATMVATWDSTRSSCAACCRAQIEYVSMGHPRKVMT